MPYCALDDLNALVPQAPFTATSKPTAASATQWIADIAVEMDASLRNVGYVTPVALAPDGTDALLSVQILKMINAYGALGQAQAARDTAVSTAVTASGREVKNIWMQRYDQKMAALTDPQDPFELPDAARTDEQLEKQPENVLRSSVQSVSDFGWTSPAVTRAQVL
jgi:hypothetical protein